MYAISVLYSNKKVIQMSRIASNSWLGFVISPARFRSTLSQQLSMIFMSGDCTRHTIPCLLCSCLYPSTIQARWTGALSSWNTYESLEKSRAITGHYWSSSISIYFPAFIFPSTLHKVPGPCQVIHLNTITETFGLHSAYIHSGRYASWSDLQT
jgi:hypothetical protein